MKIDITLELTPSLLKNASFDQSDPLAGHLGTHFDVMDKAFPLAYTERRGVVFDVSHVQERDIDIGDIDLGLVGADMFVAFYSGFINAVTYGSPAYFKEHPRLSFALIDALLEKGVSVIGVDFAGIRRGEEHTPTDQHCAEHNVFVVENLCRLEQILEHGHCFTAHTYPMHCRGITGLPCRVIAEIE